MALPIWGGDLEGERERVESYRGGDSFALAIENDRQMCWMRKGVSHPGSPYFPRGWGDFFSSVLGAERPGLDE